MNNKVYYGNGFFGTCKQSTLRGEYNCCMEKCANSAICPALCRNIYPGTIPEDCAVKQKCWIGGVFNNKCMKEKRAEIQQCCLKKCKAKDWSEIVKIDQVEGNIDCNDYCSNSHLLVHCSEV
jgi:hypothetical protein